MVYATLNDTLHFWVGTNDTAGSGNDGASAVFDVREGGASASAAPTLSGSGTLLTHANYPPGCYEIEVVATTGNGFAVNKTYGVFCTLFVDSQNPVGLVGTFRLAGVPTARGIPTDPDLTPPVLGTSDDMACLGYLMALTLNKVIVTSSEAKIRNTADTGDLNSHSLTDDGTTFTAGAAT